MPEHTPYHRAIHVKGFHHDIVPNMLRAALSRCGKIEGIHTWKSRQEKEHAFVVFRDSEGAERASGTNFGILQTERIDNNPDLCQLFRDFHTRSQKDPRRMSDRKFPGSHSMLDSKSRPIRRASDFANHSRSHPDDNRTIEAPEGPSKYSDTIRRHSAHASLPPKPDLRSSSRASVGDAHGGRDPQTSDLFPTDRAASPPFRRAGSSAPKLPSTLASPIGALSSRSTEESTFQERSRKRPSNADDERDETVERPQKKVLRETQGPYWKHSEESPAELHRKRSTGSQPATGKDLSSSRHSDVTSETRRHSSSRSGRHSEHRQDFRRYYDRAEDSTHHRQEHRHHDTSKSSTKVQDQNEPTGRLGERSRRRGASPNDKQSSSMEVDSHPTAAATSGLPNPSSEDRMADVLRQAVLKDPVEACRLVCLCITRLADDMDSHELAVSMGDKCLTILRELTEHKVPLKPIPLTLASCNSKLARRASGTEQQQYIIKAADFIRQAQNEDKPPSDLGFLFCNMLETAKGERESLGVTKPVTPQSSGSSQSSDSNPANNSPTSQPRDSEVSVVQRLKILLSQVSRDFEVEKSERRKLVGLLAQEKEEKERLDRRLRDEVYLRRDVELRMQFLEPKSKFEHFEAHHGT